MRFARRPADSAVAGSAIQQNKPVVVVAYMLAAAIVLLWAIYLSSLTSSILSGMNFASRPHAAFSRADQAIPARAPAATPFDDRWSEIAMPIGVADRSITRIAAGE